MFLDPFVIWGAQARRMSSNAREGIFCFWTFPQDYLDVEIEIGSNAREGIFCFWTYARAIWYCFASNSSNAREGIFCFWTTSALRHRRKIPVLMPARAFFVFGPIHAC